MIKVLKNWVEPGGSEAYLGMSVLAGLGGGHLHDFAGASLQHHVPVLTQGGALHGVGGGGARLTSREVKIGICHGAMGLGRCEGRRHKTSSTPGEVNTDQVTLDE